MIKKATLKKWGKKLSKTEIAIPIPIYKFVFGCKREGIEIAEDKDYLYVKDDFEMQKVADKINNKKWMQKIARHRIKEDCEGCKYLDEEKHLGKSWCEKWDTDIWNVATVFPEDKHEVNKACVPFRYFGYTPNLPSAERQSGQYSLAHYGMKNEKIVKAFVDANVLNDVGEYYAKDKENVFVGEFDENNSFGIRYNPEINKIQMKIESSIGTIEKRYEPVYSSLKQMQNDWTEIWLEKKAYNPDMNKPRPERNFDWINQEEYKKKHNPQESKHFDISPSNVGDNKNYDPETGNTFGKSDRDVGNLI
jgi:hypothetical protein